MSKLIYKKTIYSILFLSIFAIIFAYYVELVLGHQPCNLCLFERIPYILVITIIITLLVFRDLEKILFSLIGIVFLISFFLSIYHVGIEQEIFNESSVCSAGSNMDILDKEELMKNLTNQRISCKNVTFYIFGLSLATINAFISLIISFITLKIFLKYEKK